MTSQRGIAWRCQDNLSIRDFLGLGPTQRSPDHSSMTVIRKRLPFEVFEAVFRFVLARASFRNAEIVPSSPYQEARAWRQRGFFNGLLGF